MPFVFNPFTGTLDVAGNAGGWIYIEDVTVSGGTASAKVYQDAGNTVLQSVTVSGTSLTVLVRASYPTVTVNGTAGTLTRAGGGGHYTGSVAITIAGSGAVTAVVKSPDGLNGVSDVLTVTLDAPPTLTSVLFTGAYPNGPGGLQTELKQNDAFSINVVADKLFDQVEIQAFGASQIVTTNVASTLSTTVTISAADQGDTPAQFAARVRVRDAVTAAYSATRDTNFGGGTTDGVHVVTLNDLRPSGSVSSVTYPVGQSAVKDVEVATVNHTASNYDSILYSDPTAAQLTIPNLTTFEAAKVVTALNSNVYNVASTNFRYVMTRNANGAQTTVNQVVSVADVAPTITVSTPAARLRSGGNNGTAVQDYTITITSNQQLYAAPSLSADSGGSRGTLQGGAWAGGPSVWTRTLRVSEVVPDEKGTFTWEGLVATGLAGMVQNSINTGSTYVLGGFVQRSLTFAAFATTTSLGTAVTDFSKLTAGLFTATSNAALKQAIATAPPVIDGYTIDALSVNPTSLIWLDTAAAGSNSGGTAQITLLEETV